MTTLTIDEIVNEINSAATKEEMELFKTVARCGLIKEREFYDKGIRGTALNYNIKQELKDLFIL